MTASQQKKPVSERISVYALCLVISALTLGICSRSSPLYPINDWVDPNCFLTVGKAMFSGKAIYLDIYEQKGIFLYFIHGLASLVSDDSFLGVFILEVLSFSAFLYITYLIARLFASRVASALVLPPLALAILCTRAFCQGGSAEQLMLPLLLYPIYCFLRSVAHGEGGLPKAAEIYLIGAAFSLVLLSKFTMVGVFFGYVVSLALLCIMKKQFLALFQCALRFCAGAIAAFLPFLIYFLVCGSLSAFFKVYFYNNIFVYSSFEEEYTVWENIIYSFSENAVCIVAAFAGLIFLIVRMRRKETSISLSIMLFFSFFFIYVAGRFYDYYALGALFPAALGFAALAPFLDVWGKKIFKKEKMRLLAGAISLVLVLCACLPLCFVCSDNTFLLGRSRDDTWQYAFAEIIERSDDKSLLNYGSLDLGLYTATGTIPDERFFCHLNIELDEMYDEIESAIAEGRTKFVVYRGGYPPISVLQNYRIIAREQSHIDFEGTKTTYFLLERKEASVGAFE